MRACVYVCVGGKGGTVRHVSMRVWVPFFFSFIYEGGRYATQNKATHQVGVAINSADVMEASFIPIVTFFVVTVAMRCDENRDKSD